MLELNEFDKIDDYRGVVYMAWSNLAINTTADGSKCTWFSSVGIAIGSDYSSEAGSGRYYIENGVITIATYTITIHLDEHHSIETSFKTSISEELIN